MKSGNKYLQIVLAWAPAIVWATVIYIFSALPAIQTTTINWQDFIIKKTAHMTEYGIFAGLLYRAFKKSGMEKRNAGFFAIFLALLYGATDEFHQSFTPGREPRVRDVVFDTIGASLAIFAVWNLLPKAPKKLKLWAEKLELL